VVTGLPVETIGSAAASALVTIASAPAAARAMVSSVDLRRMGKTPGRQMGCGYAWGDASDLPKYRKSSMSTIIGN
jgi:hypothetical protein